jgi:hypothetical protein
LQESLAEFGQVEPVCIGPGNELYNGHQRLKSWAAKYGDIEIDVRVSSRALTEKEREKLTVFLHEGAVGEWDFDALANEFELPELIEWGFEEGELTGWGEIPHEEGQKAGASPWERMGGEASDGVVFQFGAITCRVDRQIYESFLARCPDDDISGYVAGLLG